MLSRFWSIMGWFWVCSGSYLSNFLGIKSEIYQFNLSLTFEQNSQFHNLVCDRRFWCDDKKWMPRSNCIRYRLLCSRLQSSRRRTLFNKSCVRRRSLFDRNQMFAWVFNLWTSPNGKWVILYESYTGTVNCGLSHDVLKSINFHSKLNLYVFKNKI